MTSQNNTSESKFAVSICIVNYNTSGVLEKCLENLRNLNKKFPQNFMEIIVCDNASPDDSVDMVKKKFPEVQLIEIDYNAGLTVSGNILANNARGDYLFYLGSDAFPHDGTIDGLYNYMEQPENSRVGIATSKLVLKSGELDMDAHRGFPTPWVAFTYFTKLYKVFPKSKIFNSYFMGWNDMNKPHEIDAGISHSMFIRKSAFTQIGGWDEDYFVYGEDIDICYRVKQAGWTVMYLPQYITDHIKGASVGRDTAKTITTASIETKIRMKKESVRAMRLFYTKHQKQKYNFVINFIMFKLFDWIEKKRVASVTKNV